jgi:hypothetical protein
MATGSPLCGGRPVDSLPHACWRVGWLSPVAAVKRDDRQRAGRAGLPTASRAISRRAARRMRRRLSRHDLQILCFRRSSLEEGGRSTPFLLGCSFFLRFFACSWARRTAHAIRGGEDESVRLREVRVLVVRVHAPAPVPRLWTGPGAGGCRSSFACGMPAFLAPPGLMVSIKPGARQGVVTIVVAAISSPAPWVAPTLK